MIGTMYFTQVAPLLRNETAVLSTCYGLYPLFYPGDLAAEVLIAVPCIGSQGRARTADPVINSHLLYQLGYLGIKLLKANAPVSSLRINLLA